MGADNFTFYSPPDGVDLITDFSVVDDTIKVYASEYFFNGGLTPNAAITSSQFVIGSAAVDANDRFIYNNSTGALFFDIDGNGGTEQMQFTFLPTGLAMTSDNIFVFTNY